MIKERILRLIELGKLPKFYKDFIERNWNDNNRYIQVQALDYLHIEVNGREYKAKPNEVFRMRIEDFEALDDEIKGFLIPIGGDNFTNDIAVGLRTPIPEAEKIKKKFGCVSSPLVDEQETIEVPSVGRGRKPRILSRQLLADIIQPRAEEIFRLVDNDIKRMGYEKSLNSGVVLTGGTALLEGLEEAAEEIFDLPVRQGDPTGVGGLVDRVSTPDYSTAVGLILYGYKFWQEKGITKSRKKHLWTKIRDWFKEA